MNEYDIKDNVIDSLYKRLREEAEAAGYHLNPEIDFTKELIKGLIVNDRRYGYRACPCRLASGNKEDDLDIICPCDYRDPDLTDYDTCYCSLYVSEKVVKGEKQVGSIPERRLSPIDSKEEVEVADGTPVGISLPVWRCRVCGYLCARDKPPEACPICKAKKERFEVFLKPSI